MSVHDGSIGKGASLPQKCVSDSIVDTAVVRVVKMVLDALQCKETKVWEHAKIITAAHQWNFHYINIVQLLQVLQNR